MMFIKIALFFLCFYFYSVNTRNIIVTDGYQMPCSEDDECIDFRLICDETDKICSCTRFYYWNNVTKECTLNITNLKLWLDEQSNRTDVNDYNGFNSHSLFYIQAIAGCFATVALSIVSIIICSIAFCVCKKNEENLKIIENEEKVYVTPTTSRKE